MFNFFSKETHYKIYYFSLLFAFVFVLWGKIFITISTFFLLAHFFAEGNLSEKFKTLFRNRKFIGFFIIFFYPVIALLYTEHLEKGFGIIAASLPLLVYPMAILGRAPLNENGLKKILYAYVISLLVNSVFCLLYYHIVLPDFADVRDMSRFMSHIRFSLYLNLGIVVSFYYLIINKDLPKSHFERFFLVSALIWFIIFLFLLHSMSGIVIMIILFGYFGIILVKNIFNKKLIITFIFLFSLIVFLLSFIVHKELSYFIHPNTIPSQQLENKTSRGNNYSPIKSDYMLENGNHVSYYICRSEVSEAWNKKSTINFLGKDKKGQLIEYTIYRYMTSRNLRKDYDGVSKLSDEDIKNIEKGMTNYRFANSLDIRARLYEIIWEFDISLKGVVHNYHSVTQRLRFYTCAFKVIRDNLFFGTGTGDLKFEMNKEYASGKYKLPEELWLWPHNQYLTHLGRYGLCGIFVMIFIFVYGIRSHKRVNSFFLVSWLLICCFSMLIEDTLENYNGLSLFSYFGALILGSVHDNQTISDRS